MESSVQEQTEYLAFGVPSAREELTEKMAMGIRVPLTQELLEPLELMAPLVLEKQAMWALVQMELSWADSMVALLALRKSCSMP
jgi:hypothetical protein